MGTYGPGSAWILHLQGVEPNPGPVAMTSTGTNHVCGPVTWQGQNRAAAVDCAHAQGGPGLGGGGNGLKRRRRQWRQWQWAPAAAQARAVEAQARGSDCCARLMAVQS